MRTRRQTGQVGLYSADDGEEGEGYAQPGRRPAAPKSPYMWGLLLYSLSTLFGASTSVIVKLLGGQGGMPTMQLVFVRSCVLVACTLPHLRHPAARQLIADRHVMLALRGCLGFMSVALMYCAVRLMPLSVAVSLAFLTPLLVAVLSPLLLRERPPRGALLALGLAAMGALLVAHPATLDTLLHSANGGAAAAAAAALAAHPAAPPSRLGVAAALAHAVTAAGAKITVRSLGLGSTSRHVTAVIVLSAGLTSALGAGAVCLLQRSFVAPQRLAHWVLLAAVGLVGYGHQATMTAGLQRVPVATASSLAYLSLTWSMLADWLIFNHLPTGTSMAGAAAICCAGLLAVFLRRNAGHGAGGSRPAPVVGGEKQQLATTLRM